MDTFFTESLLHNIREKNNTQVLAAIGEKDPAKLADSSGSTLLHYAAQYDNKFLTQHLIELGINVDVQNLKGETPLMYAVEYDQEGTARLLLEANADIFIPDRNGECALAKAMIYGKESYDILTLLRDKVTIESLSNSVHVDSRLFEKCPLHHFTPLNDMALTRFLLQKGCPVNYRIPDCDGETLLHQAVLAQHHQLVKLLLEFNADVNAKNDYDQTPLSLCYKSNDNYCIFDPAGMLEIVKSLLEAGAIMIDRSAQEEMIVRSVLQNGTREIIRMLLQNQIDLYFVDEIGLTPLHYLIDNDTPDILHELEGLDLDLNIRGRQGHTLMHRAVQSKNLSAMTFLLERGVDVNVTDDFGKTPLYRLIERLSYRRETTTHSDDQNTSLNLIDFLLENGADCQIFQEGLHYRPLASFEPFSDQYIEILSRVLVRLALLEVLGQAIDQRTLAQIDACRQLKGIFDSMKSQLDEFKGINIDRSVTLLDFYAAKGDKVSLFARNRRLAFNLSSVIKKYNEDLNVDSYFIRKLRLRFYNFAHLVDMRKKAALTISKIITESCNVPAEIHDVIDNIIDHLSDQDLNTMLFSFDE